MYDFNIEKQTVSALNELLFNYPYATSLLTYAFIEMILKKYIFDNRNDSNKLKTSIKVKYFNHKCKKTIWIKYKKLLGLNTEEFINDFLFQNTLEKCELLLKIKDKKYSQPRNDIMHSNTFLTVNLPPLEAVA